MILIARRRAELSQGQLSKELGFTGNAVVTRMETGERDVLLVEFIHICELADRDPVEVLEEFLTQIEGMPRKTVRETKRAKRDK